MFLARLFTSHEFPYERNATDRETSNRLNGYHKQPHAFVYILMQHIVDSFGLLLSSVFLCSRKIQDIQSHTFHTPHWNSHSHLYSTISCGISLGHCCTFNNLYNLLHHCQSTNRASNSFDGMYLVLFRLFARSLAPMDTKSEKTNLWPFIAIVCS